MKLEEEIRIKVWTQENNTKAAVAWDGWLCELNPCGLWAVFDWDVARGQKPTFIPMHRIYEIEYQRDAELMWE